MANANVNSLFTVCAFLRLYSSSVLLLNCFTECGTILGYNERVPVYNTDRISAQSITLSDFVVCCLHHKYQKDFYEKVPKLVTEGKIKHREDTFRGLYPPGKQSSPFREAKYGQGRFESRQGMIEWPYIECKQLEFFLLFSRDPRLGP